MLTAMLEYGIRPRIRGSRRAFLSNTTNTSILITITPTINTLAIITTITRTISTITTRATNKPETVPAPSRRPAKRPAKPDGTDGGGGNSRPTRSTSKAET